MGREHVPFVIRTLLIPESEVIGMVSQQDSPIRTDVERFSAVERDGSLLEISRVQDDILILKPDVELSEESPVRESLKGEERGILDQGLKEEMISFDPLKLLLRD